MRLVFQFLILTLMSLDGRDLVMADRFGITSVLTNMFWRTMEYKSRDFMLIQCILHAFGTLEEKAPREATPLNR